MNHEDIGRMIDLRKSGMSLADISRVFGISPPTVVRLLCDSGHPPTEKAVLISELLEADVPLDEIARIADTSVKTIKDKYSEYTQGSYSYSDKSANAQRIARHRAHKKNNTSYTADRSPVDINSLDPRRQYLVQCYIEPDIAYDFECALCRNQINAGEVLRRYIYDALGKPHTFRLHRSPPKTPVHRDKKSIIACNLRAQDFAEFYNYCLSQNLTVSAALKTYILHYISLNNTTITEVPDD